MPAWSRWGGSERAKWVFLLLLPLFPAACDECAGTPSCSSFPQISYGGQTIDHPTGAIVPGTSLTFVRDSGIELQADTVRAVSDEEGFFTVRVGAFADGDVRGHMVVSAPPPFQPYTIPLLTLSTSRTRGDGGFLGRIVVKPYLLLIGHVQDRKMQVPLEGVQVTMRRNSGGRLSEESMSFVTDVGGRFAWYPEIVETGTINATFDLTASGSAETYHVTRNIEPLYRDGELAFQILPVGRGFSYYGSTGRRGFGTPIPGASVEFRRISGIETQPQQITIPVSEYGTFGIPFEPVSAGTVKVELRIIPPAPFPSESYVLDLATSDDIIDEWLGFFGYGAHAYFSAELRDAATGNLLPEGTIATIKRVGGLPLLWTTPAPSEGDARAVDNEGRLTYGAPTGDSGEVVFDIIVRLPTPFMWDTVRAVTIPSFYSDTAFDPGVLHVRRRIAP